MLIKLLPPAPHPTVLFTLTFPNAQQCLPIPHSYSTLIHALNTSHPQLDLPNSIYALDKATYLLELVSEVVFDMGTGEVKCVWVDGATDVWDLRMGESRSDWELEGGVGQMLESVLRDVNESAEETEREKLREEWDKYRAAQAEALQANASAQVQIAAAAPVVKGKHKKQRSLLMTLVAALVPSTPSPPLPQINLSRLSFSSCTSLPPSQPTVQLVPPSSHPPPPAPPPYLSSRHLRRRARSTLVDVWRRYVLSDLTLREKSRGGGGGGYQDWVVRSMLNGAEGEMGEIVRANGGVVPDILPSGSKSHKDGGRFRFDVPSSPFFDDEEEEDQECPGDAGSLSTDTDGSSIHTPASTHPVTPIAPFSAPSSSSTLSPADLETYTTLHTTALHLRALQQRLASFAARQKAEERSAMSVLEIKARRRAWGNGVLHKGGAGRGHGVGGLGGLGLGVPTRVSPLRMSLCAADLEKQAEKEHQQMQASVQEIEGIVDASFCLSRSFSNTSIDVALDESYIADDLRNLVFDDLLPVPSDNPLHPAKMDWIPNSPDLIPMQPQRLFPVLEEAEPDSDSRPFEISEIGWDYEGDLEAGLLTPLQPSFDRPQIRPRTRSMHPTLGLPALTITQPQLQAPRSKKEGCSPVICQPLPSLPPPPPLVRYKTHPFGTSGPRQRERPSLVRSDAPDQQVEVQFYRPPSPASPPPPYNARDDEERRMRELSLFEYDIDLDEGEVDSVLSSEDCSTLCEDGVSEFGLKLALDSKPRLVEGRNVEEGVGEEYFVGGIVECR